MTSFFDTDITYLKGVGSRRAAILASEAGIRTFRDLLYYFPFRYVDRSRFYRIAEFEGEASAIQVKGSFVRFSEEGEGRRKRLVGLFSDGRSLIEVVWFAGYKRIPSAYPPGVELVLFGRPNLFRNSYSFIHPEIEKYDPLKPPCGLRGVYPLTEKLRNSSFTTKTFQKLMDNAFSHKLFPYAGETLPQELAGTYTLMPLGDALRTMHFPENNDALNRAVMRMKFEELFYLQLHILRFSRRRAAKVKGNVFPVIGRFFNDFYSRILPFELTGAQKRVLKEIRADMKTGRQMNRLLQGDVGCGKTLVAFMTMLIGVDNGFQAAMMAPTEILASQHYENLKQWGDAIGVNVRLLTGSTRTAERKEIHEGLLDGSVRILVGTHALIEDTVRFRKLGIAVIDEQHRFGVAQRAVMWRKAVTAPHVLIMTATPIPRTLAMTVYGDLDVSVIDELPPGRKPVETMLATDDSRQSVYSLVGRELRAGRQAYIVYPLIHENEKLSLKSLEEGYKYICDRFPSYRVCCVHGRMKPEEKDHQMTLFVEGDARIMVATTVIEVGVNVPNASVMIIENAERFGLSQLHQLRGRVGRGADKSYCILMSRQKLAGTTRKRLGIMTETNDGFLISEADMKLRGFGDIEGTQQSGIPFDLHVADLAHDSQILTLAREAAVRILDSNPALAAVAGGPENCDNPIALSQRSVALVEAEMRYRFSHTADWSRIS